MKCYVCGEEEGLIGERRPRDSASLDDWEDFRIADIMRQTGNEVSWLDIVYFVVNDPLFRVNFLTESAEESPRYIAVPTFTLNDDLVDFNAKLATEGIPKSRRRNARTDKIDLINYIAWYVEEHKDLLRTRNPKIAPYVIMSYRERIHDEYDAAVHYNGIIIDVGKKLVYLFDPGVGLWGDLNLETALRAAVKMKKFKQLFGDGFQVRWLVRGCHIQKPKGVPGETVTRDNYCQTWSLYVFYRFIVDGGETAKVTAKLKEMQTKWSQEEVLAFIGDDFLLGVVRLSDAYDDALKDDKIAWSELIPVVT